MLRTISALVGAAVVIAACESDPVGPVHIPCDPLLGSFQALTSSDTVTVTPSIRYFDVKAGTGAQAEARRLSEVNYTLYAEEDGTDVLDSSCPPNRGVLQVIPGNARFLQGFEIAIVGMREGGVRRLILSPEAAYTSPNHPLYNKTLTFDLQLVSTDD